MARQLPNPVIVVPGITATYLRDEYSLPPEIVWSVMTKDFERLALHPDNPARIDKHPRGTWYENQQPARVRADQVFEVAYRELVEELRHGLCKKPDQPIPVYPFGYDWRQPLELAEVRLAEFIDEVIERACLQKHYVADGFINEPGVNLVGHSMGGLIVAGCLQRLGKASRVTKVATLAAPFRGSFEAVLKMTTGTANLGGSDASSREREMARLTPAIYYLIPTCTDAADFADGLPKTFFEPDAWQPKVKETISTFIKRNSLQGGPLGERAAGLFKRLLEAASAHRARLEGFKLASAGLDASAWLCVVGVHSKTRVRLPVIVQRGKPEFDLDAPARLDQWGDTKLTPEERRKTGDGTVPFLGAAPAFLGEENLVCVTPDDFGYWEVQDRLLSATAGFHGILPNMDMLHRLIVRHFTGASDSHGNTWGRPAPGVAEWRPPFKITRKS